MRTAEPVEVHVLRDVEACLSTLEGLGRVAFNVYPSRYEEVPEPSVAEAVWRLRSLGATSGISHEGSGPRPRVRFWVDRGDPLDV
jgi:hypothetical protein